MHHHHHHGPKRPREKPDLGTYLALGLMLLALGAGALFAALTH
jgi:hypothetical protein